MWVPDDIGLVVCSSAWSFGNKILGELEGLCEKEKAPFSAKIVETTVTYFWDTEIKTFINESVRHYGHLFIIQDCENHYPRLVNEKRVIVPSTVELRKEGLDELISDAMSRGSSKEREHYILKPSVEDNASELESAIDSAQRSDIERVTVIIPSFPYARQDKAKGREGITASRFAARLENYRVLRRVVTQDIHNNAIAGFFREATLLDIHASKHIMSEAEKLPEDVRRILKVSQTDINGSAMAVYYAERMGRPWVPAAKMRDYSRPGTVKEVKFFGDVRECFLFEPDDMTDTAGSFIEGVEAGVRGGALGIYGAFSLGLFNGPAVDRINRLYDGCKGPLKGVISTNAVYHPPYFYKANPWLTVVPMEKVYAELIFALHQNQSVSHLLE